MPTLDPVALAALPIGTTNAQAYASNASALDTIVNGVGVVPSRTGKSLLSIDEAMRRIGYETPVAFASGISVSRGTQTVVNAGVTYHANPSSLPFTTTSTFNSAQWLLVSNVSAQDLASPALGKGASTIGLHDAAGKYDSDDVEGALAEVQVSLDTLRPALDLAGAGAALNMSGGKIAKARQNGYYNLHPGRLTRWSSALARHRAGVGTAKLAFVGDSITAGVGSNPSASNTDIRRRSFPALVSQILTARYGVKASNMGFFGDGWESGNFTTADPRVTRGTSWQTFTTMVPGGWAHRDATNTLTAINFVPSATVATDRLDVWVLTYPGYGDFVVSTAGTFNGSGATNSASPGVKKYTISRTASTTAWSLQKSGSTPNAELIILGMEAWVAADNPVRVWNMGAAGSKVGDWSTPNEPWNAKNALQNADYAPDLTVIGLTVNDWANATTETNYKNALAALVTAALVTGDCVLVAGVPSNIGTATVARQAEVTQWMLDIAAQYDVPAIIMTDRWVSQSYRPDRGLYYDGLHPSNVGYWDMAEVITRVICEA